MISVIEMRKELGKRIKEFRKRAHITQEQLASSIGVTNRAVSNWESGANGVDVDLVPALCNALHISANDLLNTPIENELSPESTEFARQYETLDSAGKELLQVALQFALKHFANNPLPIESAETVVLKKVRMPVITGIMDGTIETEFAAKQEVREMDEAAEPIVTE